MLGKKSLAIIAVVLIGIISGIAAAQASGAPIPASPQTCISNAASTSFNACMNQSVDLAAIAILLSFSVVALAYLIGEVFDFAVLKGWYRTEAWEIAKTIILVVMLFATISIIGSVAAGFLSPTNTCPTGANLGVIYCYAEGYLANQSTVALSAIDAEIGISIGQSAIRSPTFRTYLPLPILGPCETLVCTYASLNFGSDENIFGSDIIQTSVKSGDSIVKNTLNLLVIPMYLLITSLYYAFYVIVYAGLGILLPIGIIFRAIPFLRGIGGMVIALAIGMGLVMPLLLVGVNSEITGFLNPSAHLSYSVGGCGGTFTSITAFVCNFFQTFYTTVVDPVAAPLTLAIGQPAYAGYQAGASSLTLGAYPVLNVLFQYVTPLAFEFILLVIDLIVGFALLQGIAKLLGGSLRLGIGKMQLA